MLFGMTAYNKQIFIKLMFGQNIYEKCRGRNIPSVKVDASQATDGRMDQEHAIEIGVIVVDVL
jgi:hypothetical protein